MRYFSTHDHRHTASFAQAVLSGLAPDRGLYFPEELRPLPRHFWTDLGQKSDAEIAVSVLQQFVEGVIDPHQLHDIIEDALDFPFPVTQIQPGVHVLELFHGPTLAFKDVGARCMGRILPYCIDQERETLVLVATSGDTGAAVAHGFLGVDGVRVMVLYPAGKVSALQE
ncbi:MAG: threonine synthase, partial [Saprospiraceae bacterium]|nr:threonine synthase [Saprospiraceae bacterium]